MPELPDVETMRRYLQATSLHQEIEDVAVHSDQVLERTSAEELKEDLTGRSFASTRRHGKWMFVALDGEVDRFLVLHFGMTGGLKYFEDLNQEPKYDRVLFHFANGCYLAYQAMRKLGQVSLIGDVERFVDRKDLGPDALDPDFDLATFKETLADRRAMAKSLLMDQHTIAGIGNVYADEMLFQAGIHPRTTVDHVDGEALEELFHAMKDVLRTAIEHQARPDQFPDSYIAPHRHGDGRCPICGADLERVKVSSRSAYYCPNRQQKEGD